MACLINVSLSLNFTRTSKSTILYYNDGIFAVDMLRGFDCGEFGFERCNGFSIILV